MMLNGSRILRGELDQLALEAPKLGGYLAHDMNRHASGHDGKLLSEADEINESAIRLIPRSSPTWSPALLAGGWSATVKEAATGADGQRRSMIKSGMPRFDKLSAEELEQIKRFIESTDIDVIDHEMRALVEKHWPWLLTKLPPRTVQ